MRIPKISYAPLIGATNQGYQIQQNKLSYQAGRLDYKIQKQQLALGWADLGLKAAGILVNVMQNRDMEKARAAKLETLRELDAFTAERLARNDFEWTEERGEGGELLGRRPNWEKMYNDFRESYANKFTGKESPFTFDATKNSYEEFLQDAFRQQAMKMTAEARAQMENEWKAQADANLKSAIETDMNKPDGAPDASLGLIRAWQADGHIKKAQADILLDQAGKSIKKGQLDRQIYGGAQNGDFKGSSDLLNKNKELYTPQEFNDRQSNVRTMYQEFKFKLEEGFNEVFTNPMMKNEPIDTQKVRNYIETSKAPEEQKAKWNQTFDAWQNNEVDRIFNETFNDPAIFDNYNGLVTYKKEVQEDSVKYAGREKMQTNHLREIEARMKQMELAEKRGIGDGGGKPDYTEGVTEAALMYKAMKEKQIDPLVYQNRLLRMLQNGRLDGNLYHTWSERGDSFIDKEGAEAKAMLRPFLTITDKGERLLSIEDSGKYKKIQIPIEAEEGFYKALDDGLKGGWIKQGDVAPFVKKYFQPYLVQGLNYTDAKGALRKLGLEPLRESEYNLKAQDRADNLRSAIQQGELSGQLYFAGGRLEIAPVVKPVVEALWREDQRQFETITGLNLEKGDYKVETGSQWTATPGLQVYKTKDNFFQWTVMDDGNSVLTRAGRDGTKIWEPTKKQWVSPADYMAKDKYSPWVPTSREPIIDLRNKGNRLEPTPSAIEATEDVYSQLYGIQATPKNPSQSPSLRLLK